MIKIDFAKYIEERGTDIAKISKVTGISRPTLLNAKKTNEMSEQIFYTLSAKLDNVKKLGDYIKVGKRTK